MNLTGLPSMEFAFDINVKGETTGKNYQGKFKYQRLNYAKRSEAAKLTAQLNGDLLTLEPAIKVINFMLGILQNGLIESPEWWKECDYGLDLYDFNIITEIYDKINIFEQKWKVEVWGTEPEKPKLKEENNNDE
ncbi:unnamed protein product [marine sediment metagenome]|uniref:Uncharacterized protein n=1 Tax=marine sediment metagenome TaxID=412755 RepID=X0TGE3_9ZZZZ